jgi:hypothetical protein
MVPRTARSPFASRLKPHHWEAEAEDQVECLIEQRNGGDQVGGRDQVVIGTQGGKAADEERHREPGPHQRIPEEGGNDGVTRSGLGKGQGNLHQGVGKPLVLHPLAAQDNGGRDHGSVEPGGEDAPGDQRTQPGRQRNVDGRWGTFVEPTNRRLVLWGQPFRDEGMDQLSPVIFRGGVVEAAADDGHEVFGETHGGHGGGHQPHDIYHEEFSPPQYPVWSHESDGDIRYPDQKEEQANCSRRAEIEGHVGTADNHIAVGCPHGDAECNRRSK